MHGNSIHLSVDQRIDGVWDREALKRVFENLISNAIKYGQDGGDILLEATISFQEVIVRVHNFGSFIPLDQREKLFSIFKQVKAEQSRNKQGWGVGLLMVKGAVEGHGGGVTVESDPESGTTFIVTLPTDTHAIKQH